jgi:S-adenosylmethionine:tRNA ribosyltransferase-isomerase
LSELLAPDDCLVVNNTKVIPAKLVGFRKSTRGRWTGLFLEADAQGNWKLLCKTRGRIQSGETVILQDVNGVERMELVLLTRLEGGEWVARPKAEGTTDEILTLVGRVPLPHYIRDGNMVDSDRVDYQTVYATQIGAVAAPTAGLHFTKGMIKRLIDDKINIAQVTLHVGIGTFRPMTADRVDDHSMHREWGTISENAVKLINQSREAGGRIIAVGTTSVRVLETAGRSGTLAPWSGDTDLFIHPPFQFKVIDGLLTNFHLPRSTLLVLVRTFGGDELIKRAYQVAIDEKYRFFSYGDAMLIL